ncbi:hypothetical protein YC2023_118544 [Brassica napus]
MKAYTDRAIHTNKSLDPRPMFHLTNQPWLAERPGWSPLTSFMVGYCKYLE